MHGRRLSTPGRATQQQIRHRPRRNHPSHLTQRLLVADDVIETRRTPFLDPRLVGHFLLLGELLLLARFLEERVHHHLLLLLLNEIGDGFPKSERKKQKNFSLSFFF